MRKILALARRPVVWLSVLAFAFWLIVLRAVVPPPPAHTVFLGVIESHGRTSHSPSCWSELRHISDDGSQVTFEVINTSRHLDFDSITRLRVIDSRTGDDHTPQRWADVGNNPSPDCQVLRQGQLWDHPEGRAFVYDEEAWAKLRARFPTIFAGDASPIQSDWWEFKVSPDGRLVAFHSRDGEPAYREDAEGISVEEIRTGRRVAFLRGAVDRVHLAPGGQTAVTELKWKEINREHTRLAVWDLATSSVRLKLSLPTDHAIVTFTPDGRFVFAEYYLWSKGSARGIRWWNISTGQQIGHVERCSSPLLTASGWVLVTRQDPPKRWRENAVQFWDVGSGESLGTKTLDIPVDGWRDHSAADCGGRRYLLFQFKPRPGRLHDSVGCHAENLYQSITGHKPPDPVQAMVWDAVERREVLRVPGKKPALSANGRWLATLDEEGVIRVWDVNALAPWTHALGYAIAAAAMTVVGAVLGLRYVRWCRMGRRRWWWAILPAIVLLIVVANTLYVNWPDSP